MFAPLPKNESRAPMWKMTGLVASRMTSSRRQVLIALLVLCVFPGTLLDGPGYHAAATQPMPVPTHELAAGERELLYTFPMAARNTSVAPLHYRFTFKGTETVARDPNPIEKRYDCSLNVRVLGADLRGQRNLPRGSMDLVMTIETMRLLCFAGRGSYTFELTEDMLRERRPTTSTLKYGLDDIYEGSSTLRSIRESPGALRMNNGALLAPPDPPVLLSLVDCEYMFDLIAMMIPPMPRARIKPGQAWTGGVPVRFSVYAEPRVVRFRVKYESIEEVSGRAVVTWSAEMERASLVPVAGIHHIQSDAAVTGPFSGRLVLDRDGRILSSDLTMAGEIVHAHSGSPKVTFDYTMRLDLLADQDSDAIADALESASDDDP